MTLSVCRVFSCWSKSRERGDEQIISSIWIAIRSTFVIRIAIIGVFPFDSFCESNAECRGFEKEENNFSLNTYLPIGNDGKILRKGQMKN